MSSQKPYPASDIQNLASLGSSQAHGEPPSSHWIKDTKVPIHDLFPVTYTRLFSYDQKAIVSREAVVYDRFVKHFFY